MEKQIDNLIKIYKLTDEHFEDYYKTVELALTTGKTKTEKSNLIIVGGQSGAGKSRLIPIAKRELEGNAIIVDFDELRALHPHYKIVTENYPELTHRILHYDTNKVKSAILIKLIEEKYNVIYEGALRDTQGFVDLASNFKSNGYNVKMDIMAVCKLESFGSTFVRYATALITNSMARWVEKSAHDESYEGVLRTVKAFYDEDLIDETDVFVRGNESTPKRIYKSKGKNGSEVENAINFGRETGRKKAVEDFVPKYKMVEQVLKEKNPILLSKLSDWKELYESELAYFKMLSGDQSEL